MNRSARAPELINKALDRGHVRLALFAMAYISREHGGSGIQSIKHQLSFALPAIRAAETLIEKGGLKATGVPVMLAAEPFMRRLMELHRMHYTHFAHPEDIDRSIALDEMLAAGVSVDKSALGAFVPAWAVEARRLGRLQEVALDSELQDSLTAELLLRGEV